MLYSEIIAVFSQIHTEHINTLCEQNVELLILKLLTTWSKDDYKLILDVLIQDNEVNKMILFREAEWQLIS